MPLAPRLGKRMRHDWGGILPKIADRASLCQGAGMAENSGNDDAAACNFPPNAVHVVRTSQQITMQLSQMADQKASILMGATFVVFTLAVGQARSGALALPLAILATFSFLSALLAVSAVLPRVGKAPPVLFRDGKDHSNLLFFGRFAQMEEDEFIAAIKDRLRGEEDMYEMMLRDTYQNGVVLARRKYRYLAYAYRLFVIGLTLTFAAFLWEVAPRWMG
jgi:Family of unknown function (DUF5706)